MRQLGLFLFACLALVGCRPSKAEVAKLQSDMAALQAEQSALADNVETLEAWNKELERDRDQATLERQRVRGATDDLVIRIAELEAQKPAPRPTGAPTVRRPDPDKRHRVDIGAAHFRGRADAKITIVMFLDYQCPFCKRSQDTMRKIEKRYKKDVRFVFKHLPLAFHKQAMGAAKAAEAAGKQDKFWKMHDLLFDNNRDLGPEKFVKLAGKLRLKKSRFMRDQGDANLEQKIKNDQAQAAALGVRGTPGFFVNGMFLSGAQPFATFEKLIDKEMAIANDKISAGIKKSEYYEVLMREALPPSG